jgi:hypothetical protein|tara:strand:+ start:400 stop:612 length:213 start_codon:yes stop_codon:yes gene_type:complete
MIDVMTVIEELKEIKDQLQSGNVPMAIKKVDEGIAYREKEVADFEAEYAPKDTNKMPLGDLANDPFDDIR